MSRPKLTVETMMSDMKAAGVFDRAERQMAESQARAAQIFGRKSNVSGKVRIIGFGAHD